MMSVTAVGKTNAALVGVALTYGLELPRYIQAIAKSIIAFHQKFSDEQTKRELKELLLQYDKGLLVADPRRCEPKKFGGKGARARFQKSYR